jgi:hypothetical protein
MCPIQLPLKRAIIVILATHVPIEAAVEVKLDCCGNSQGCVLLLLLLCTAAAVYCCCCVLLLS